MVCDYEDWVRGLGHKRTWVTGWREVGDVWLLKIGLCVCDKDRRPPNLIRGNSLYLSLCWENPTPASHLSHLPYHRGVILNQSSLYFNTSRIMYLLWCIENFSHRFLVRFCIFVHMGFDHWALMSATHHKTFWNFLNVTLTLVMVFIPWVRWVLAMLFCWVQIKI